MKMRNWLNNNSAVVTILAVVVLILSLATIILSTRQGSFTPQDVPYYFYDLDAKELFVGKSSQTPPIDTPAGGKRGVKAYVYSCGDCADESTRFVGYLEMYTPEAKEMQEKMNRNDGSINYDDPNNDPMMVVDRGRRIADVKGEKWFSYDSVDGVKIIEYPSTRCPDGSFRECYPPKQ